MRHIVLIAALVLAGCPGVCQHLDVRCAGSALQVCDADRSWQPVMDCAQVEPGPDGPPAELVCCATESGPTCVPQEACL